MCSVWPILAPNGRTMVGHMPQETVAQSDSNKAVPSIKTVSDAEKAKSRAERFGVAAATDLDEKKAARAARFGISNASNKIGNLYYFWGMSSDEKKNVTSEF